MESDLIEVDLVEPQTQPLPRAQKKEPLHLRFKKTKSVSDVSLDESTTKIKGSTKTSERNPLKVRILFEEEKNIDILGLKLQKPVLFRGFSTPLLNNITPQLLHYIGITSAPGKKGSNKQDRTWDRNLKKDLTRLRDCYKPDTIVCLLTEREMEKYGISDLLSEVAQLNLQVLFYPQSRDVFVDPSPSHLEQTHILIEELSERFYRGQSLVICCKDGLGSSAVVGACLLVNIGGVSGALDAINTIRTKRSEKCFQNHLHQDFVKDYETFAINRSSKEKVKRLINLYSPRDQTRHNIRLFQALCKLGSQGGKQLEEMDGVTGPLLSILSSTTEPIGSDLQKEAVELAYHLAISPRLRQQLVSQGIFTSIIRLLNSTRSPEFQQMLFNTLSQLFTPMGSATSAEVFLKEGGIEEVAKGLAHKESEVQLAATRVVRSLALSGNRAQTQLRLSGALPHLVALLAYPSEDFILQSAGSIRNVACDNALNRAELCTHGAVNVLVRRLDEDHPEEVGLCLLDTVLQLSVENAPMHVELRKVGGLNTLLKFLNNSDSPTQFLVASIIRNVAMDNVENQTELGARNTLEELMGLLEAERRDHGKSMYISSIWALTKTHPKNVERITQAGLLPYLTGLMISLEEVGNLNPDQIYLLANCLALLHNVTYDNDANQEYVRENRGIDLIVNWLDAQNNMSIIQSAAGAMSAICYNNVTNIEACLAKGAAIITSKLLKFNKNHLLSLHVTSLLWMFMKHDVHVKKIVVESDGTSNLCKILSTSEPERLFQLLVNTSACLWMIGEQNEKYKEKIFLAKGASASLKCLKHSNFPELLYHSSKLLALLSHNNAKVKSLLSKEATDRIKIIIEKEDIKGSVRAMALHALSQIIKDHDNNKEYFYRTGCLIPIINLLKSGTAVEVENSIEVLSAALEDNDLGRESVSELDHFQQPSLFSLFPQLLRESDNPKLLYNAIRVMISLIKNNAENKNRFLNNQVLEALDQLKGERLLELLLKDPTVALQQSVTLAYSLFSGTWPTPSATPTQTPTILRLAGFGAPPTPSSTRLPPVQSPSPSPSPTKATGATTTTSIAPSPPSPSGITRPSPLVQSSQTPQAPTLIPKPDSEAGAEPAHATVGITKGSEAGPQTDTVTTTSTTPFAIPISEKTSDQNRLQTINAEAGFSQVPLGEGQNTSSLPSIGQNMATGRMVGAPSHSDSEESDTDTEELPVASGQPKGHESSDEADDFGTENT